jgi:hypothetical protein
VAKLIHYFKDTDLRYGHNGLTIMAARKKLDPQTMGAGEFILFVNRTQTMFKLLGPNRTLVHVKSERGKVDFRVLHYLPKQFSGQSFNYDEALRKVLENDWKRKKGKQHV